MLARIGTKVQTGAGASLERYTFERWTFPSIRTCSAGRSCSGSGVRNVLTFNFQTFKRLPARNLPVGWINA
jgi:hypothetical protein